MSNVYQILLIEDDEAVGASLVDGLGLDGYQVHWARTAKTGLEDALRQRPHLVILDVRLPDGSGLDVCKQMRTQRLRQPILMLTVQRDELDKVLGLEMGADDYMTKPFSLRELRSRVRALIRRAYGSLSISEGDVFHAGGLVIDRSSGQVQRHNKVLNLTPTEFRILVFLAQHPGQVLSRQQILNHVWGINADVEKESTVNVHIRRLRAKIEDNPSAPKLVMTVPGIGYRLDVT